MATTRTMVEAGRIEALAAAVDVPVERIAPFIRDQAAGYESWVDGAPLPQVTDWLKGRLYQLGLTVHWHGMAIGEFAEDGRVVFVPAWANGSLDPRSIAGTPRFATLDEAKAAVDAEFARIQQERDELARRRAASPAPSQAERDRLILAASLAARPEYDPTICWECGGPIAHGDGILDEPMGYAHRSCIGA